MANTHFPKYLPKEEARIINRLITAILTRGFNITVYDGDCYVLRNSTNRKKIQAEVAATDHTTFIIRDQNHSRLGWFLLIHGNLCDVVSDYTDNPICEQIWEEIRPTVEMYS